MTINGALTDIDEGVPGEAEFIEQREGEDDARCAEQLAAHMENVGLDRGATRGVGDAYRAIVQRIRGRRLVADLGEHEFSVGWLSFHVPRGGKGQLKLSSSRTLGYGVKLEFLGLGFGSGRRRTFTIEEDFLEREQCLTLGRRLRARIRTFADRGKDTASHVQVDVLAVLAEERSAHDPCHECSDDPQAYELTQVDTALDLRGDPVGQVYQRAVKIEGDQEMEFAVPIPFPGLKLTPSIAIKRSTQLECELKYQLPGGFVYTPLQRVDGWSSLPIWRRS